jgi:hypothetical protein
VIPRAAAQVAAELGVELGEMAAHGAGLWGVLKPGDAVKVGDILFPRLDRAVVLGGD